MSETVRIKSTKGSSADTYHTTDCRRYPEDGRDVDITYVQRRDMAECKYCSGEFEPSSGNPMKYQNMAEALADGGTKLEHYTESDRSDHELAKARLRSDLQRTDVANTLTAKELAQDVPVSVSTVRDLVQELRADGLPVWSNGHGYYVIQSGEELDRVIEAIRDEIATKEETMEQLCKGFNNR